METNRVKDYSHFQWLVSQAKIKHGRLNRTNLLLFKAQLEVLINRGLDYRYVDGGICFFEKKGPNQRLYYMLSKETQAIKLNIKHLVVEFIEKNQGKTEANRLFLEQSGFHLVAIHNEMLKTISEEERIITTDEVKYANQDEKEAIQRLWTSRLDIVGHPLPTMEELSQDIECNEVVVIRDDNNQVVAAMTRRVEHSVCYLERVVSGVKSRGYGTKLVQSCYRDEEIRKLRLFVNAENHSAIHFYKKHLFINTGKQLFQFNN